MMTFNWKYFALFVLIFIAETIIALYVRDSFFRPYFGDVLVVMLIYCFLKSFVNLKPLTAGIVVLLFAFLIEFGQYLNFVEILNLQDSKMARTVLGTSFSWADMTLYTLGILLVLGIEKFRSDLKHK